MTMASIWLGGVMKISDGSGELRCGHGWLTAISGFVGQNHIAASLILTFEFSAEEGKR